MDLLRSRPSGLKIVEPMMEPNSGSTLHGSQAMPRKAAGLIAAKVKTAKAGRYCDGNGLWLYVRDTGVRSWVLRFQIAGTPREMGLGKANASGDARLGLI